METKTKEQYKEFIKESIDWNKVKTDCENEKQEVEGGIQGYSFLGTVFRLSPSGKYYTPFANSNVNEEEASEDEKFYEALDEVAEAHGYHIENGEGDPCDIFICKFIEDDDTGID